MSVWKWQDFNYIAIGNTDSRRAAFLLYDFLNMFHIDKFQVIASFGEHQNQSITIVYVEPTKYRDDEIEDRWYEHIKKLQVEEEIKK